MGSYNVHLNIVNLLISQYRLIKKSRCLEISQIISLEKRILISLFVLSGNITTNELDPDSYADTFIYLARRLLSKDTEVQEIACQSACQWLNETRIFCNDNERASAAYDIIYLFTSQQMQYQLQLTYDKFENLRACIFSIWIKQSYNIDDSIIQTAESQKDDSALKSRVISYKAHFKIQDYEVLLESYTSSEIKRVVEQGYSSFTEIEKKSFIDMLWQCLQLNIDYGSNLLELLLNEQKLDKGLLRLASLTGDNRYLPYLSDYFILDPDVGYYFLSLLGTYEAAEEIMHGLKSMRAINSGSYAWFLLTGMKIPMKSRLSIADEENENYFPGNQSPDTGEIEQWWVKHSDNLRKDKRWLNGKSHCLKEIISSLLKYAGEYNDDLLCLYKLEIQDSMFSDMEDGWYLNKLNQYIKLENSYQSASKPEERPIEYA